jgi:two-component system chemotaxis sensor kinase CheA
MMSRKKLEVLNNGIGHLLRNALDHAIETPELRISKNKPPVGKIIFDFNMIKDQIIISLSDDGKGINPEFIATKAVEKGFIQQAEVNRMSDEEKLNLIFIPGFSSKENASSISGRGVGMDVVNSMVKDWNGTMTVTSIVNVGTQINITLNKGMNFNKIFLEQVG